MKEILKNIWTWSKFSEEKGYDFNSYLISDEKDTVIIDPVIPSEEDLNFIKSKSPNAIYLTNKDHERYSHELKNIFNVDIWINELDVSLLKNKIENTFINGEKLLSGIEVIHLNDQKSPGESAFYISSREILILGDALIGHPSGSLKLLPPEKYKDINKAKNELLKLLDLSFNALLLGDGQYILNNAKEVVKNFLLPVRL